MVIGLLALAAIPSVIGVGNAVSAQKRQNLQAKEQAKFYLSARVFVKGEGFQDAYCVLVNGKIYLDHPSAPLPSSHRFGGHYYTYPGEEQHLGLVSTIQDDPPMLNWVFADKDTCALRHGGRGDTLGQLVGPWGWSNDEDGEFLTLMGQEGGFLAVLEDFVAPASDSGQQEAGAGDEEGRERRRGGAVVAEKKWAVYVQPKLVLGGSKGGGIFRKEGREVRRIRLRRRMALGMESRYVRDTTR